jgi:hypothetical protein
VLAPALGRQIEMKPACAETQIATRRGAASKVNDAGRRLETILLIFFIIFIPIVQLTFSPER